MKTQAITSFLPLLPLFAGCAGQAKAPEPAPARVIPVTRVHCPSKGWDDVHQKLFDAGVMYRREMKICHGEKEKLYRMLDVRTSTAARIEIKKLKNPGTPFKDIALYILGGFAAGYITHQVVQK